MDINDINQTANTKVRPKKKVNVAPTFHLGHRKKIATTIVVNGKPWLIDR